MINCSEKGILLKGKPSEIFTRLIKDDNIDIYDLFTIFEAISLNLRGAFDDKGEK